MRTEDLQRAAAYVRIAAERVDPNRLLWNDPAPLLRVADWLDQCSTRDPAPSMDEVGEGIRRAFLSVPGHDHDCSAHACWRAEHPLGCCEDKA